MSENLTVGRAVLLKYGELVLKGLNRSYFEGLLRKRVKRVLKNFDGHFNTETSQSVLIIRGDENADIDGVFEAMKKIFGIVSVCLGYECEKDMEKIKKATAYYAPDLLSGAKTFKCNAKRSDKSFEYGSPEICAICGGVILDEMPAVTVDVHNPEVCVTIEIRENSAFIHGGGVHGAGGMPTGSNGRAMLLLSGGIDSPVAGHMIAKRGLEVDGVYFDSPPYTGEPAEEKVKSLAEVLTSYTGRMYLNIISVTEIQEKIVEKCDRKLSTVLLRRFMMRLAQRVAKETKSKALITGESIGQVASQTIDALTVTDAAVDLPVFRPCIGLDKEEIVTRAREIGTFELSSLPYEDCCTVFTPDHPNTKPTLAEIIENEELLDVAGLEDRAYATRRVIKLGERKKD